MKKIKMDRYDAIEKRIEEGDVVVDYILSGKKHKAKVVGFNFSIGSTFVSNNNTDVYLLCTHGTLDPRFKNTPNPHKKLPKLKAIYLKTMDLLLLGIEKGCINWDEIENQAIPAGTIVPYTNRERCPFNN